jgi:hypothetical protein
MISNNTYQITHLHISKSQKKKILEAVENKTGCRLEVSYNKQQLDNEKNMILLTTRQIHSIEKRALKKRGVVLTLSRHLLNQFYKHDCYKYLFIKKYELDKDELEDTRIIEDEELYEDSDEIDWGYQSDFENGENEDEEDDEFESENNLTR